jgi:hypothetical protein
LQQTDLTEVVKMGKRKETASVRSQRLSPRVVDALSDIGHGDKEKGRVRFIEHALWVAGQQGLRVWSGDIHQQKRAAANSLRNLLGENKYDGWDSSKTAGNTHWVMDIWEAACDDWFRVAQVKPPEEVARVNGQVEVTSEAGLTALRRLSARLLDAYLARNSDEMLELLQELEHKGL